MTPGQSVKGLNMETTTMTAATLKLFLDLAKDAGNWNGMPMLDGNVKSSKELRGNLTHLKRAGLLGTQVDDGQTWVFFTDKGMDLAESHGINRKSMETL